jgi:hypothetical protein
MGIVRYWYWHLILPVPVLAFLHLCSVTVQAQSITCIGIHNWCLYRYWHFCSLVQYQYGHISLPELGFINGSSTGIGIFILLFIISIGTGHYWYRHSMVPVPVLEFGTLVQYQYGHIPLPVLVFHMARTSNGISALLCSTGIGTFHYRYWYSTMVPVLVRAFLHFGSVPV